MPGVPLCAFDLDGTLIDSARDIHQHLNTALALVGHPTLTLAQALPLIGHGARNLVERAMPGASGPTRDRALEELQRAYGAHPVVHTVAHAGAAELLTALRGRGIRTSVVTNKPQPLADAVLLALGLMPLLDAVHGGQPGVALKPSPDLLARSMAQVRADRATTVMVGDSVVDLETAQAVGCAFVGVAFGMDAGAGLVGRGAPVHAALPSVLPAVLRHLGMPS